MPAIATMTDAELDARLVRLFKQHAAASTGQRAEWARMSREVLAEQGRRLDAWLGARV